MQPQDLLIGSTLGKYQIVSRIGRGGMGAVYKGYDPLLDRYLAVKVLAPHLVWEEGFVERFLREARAAARLKHPHIVTIHDVGQVQNWYYFVMEYLEGFALNDIIQQCGALPICDVLKITKSLANALDYAHGQNLIHRDIKPANIMVDHNGHITLTDFGIARAAQERRMTSTGTVLGTPEYMSPEQARGEPVDTRSDLYSLAMITYQMLCGQVAFKADSTLALLFKVVHDPLPSICAIRSDLPQGVDQVLQKALAKQPEERYAKANLFYTELEQAFGSYSDEQASVFTPELFQSLSISVPPDATPLPEMPVPTNPGAFRQAATVVGSPTSSSTPTGATPPNSHQAPTVVGQSTSTSNADTVLEVGQSVTSPLSASPPVSQPSGRNSRRASFPVSYTHLTLPTKRIV